MNACSHSVSAKLGHLRTHHATPRNCLFRVFIMISDKIMIEKGFFESSVELLRNEQLHSYQLKCDERASRSSTFAKLVRRPRR